MPPLNTAHSDLGRIPRRTSSRHRHHAVIQWYRPGVMLLLLLALLLPAQRARAATRYYVNDDAPADGNGLSWGSAFRYLQAANLAVGDGDEIWVAAGVYHPDVFPGFGDTDSPTANFFLKSGVAIYGGFAGNETQLSQRNISANVTVLSGDITQNDTTDANGIVTNADDINESGPNSNQVVIADNVDPGTILDGFTITAGKATDDLCPSGCGGGLYVIAGSLTLANIIFIGNHAELFGGGMYNLDGSLTLTNVTFIGNRASDGGGMFNGSNSSTLTNVTFIGNRASDGGGIHNSNGSPTLTNVTFSGNRATNGGGMYNFNGFGTLTNVTFSGNRAASGGGLYNEISMPTLTNVTFGGNQANGGGGLYNEESDPLLQNTILWDNLPESVSNDIQSNSTYRHSLVQGLNPGDVGNLDGTNSANNPRFVLPVDCGSDGCTDDPITMTIDESANDDYGDLRLQSSSPAVDAGDNAADLNGAASGTTTIANIDTDLAGQPRIVGVKSLPAKVDMGAYEAENNPPNAHTGGPYAIAEGSPLALNAAASSDDGSIVSYSWDCTNDGTVDFTSNSSTGNTCTYPNSGGYSLRLVATDHLNATGTATTTVTASNVAPTYTPDPNQSTNAGVLTLFQMGAFSDPGAEGTWAISINWGDNSTPTQFTVNSTGALLEKSHIYTSAGSYNVVVTVNDDAANHKGGFQVVVNAAPPGAPTVTAPANQAGAAGTEQSFSLGSFTDVGSSGPWSVTVAWGDASPSTLFSVTSSGEIPAKPHSYAAAGDYEVLVTVSDGVLSTTSTFVVTIPEELEERTQIFLPTTRKP